MRRNHYFASQMSSTVSGHCAMVLNLLMLTHFYKFFTHDGFFANFCLHYLKKGQYSVLLLQNPWINLFLACFFSIVLHGPS
jgi:hypothetical protein